MMGAVEMLALSLGLSVGVAALGLAGGALVERMTGDPGLRDRTWGAALILPLLPPVATALLLMTPAPVREVVAPTAPPVAAAQIAATTGPAAAGTTAMAFDPGLFATAILLAAGALVLLRLLVLTRRARRLSALLTGGQAADEATTDLVREVSRGLLIPAPVVVVSTATTEPLLTGLGSARLVLPTALSGDAAVRRAVITHELAHLKRGDHRALWIEELALALLAANPLMPLLRTRRSAAREEACDAVALAGAGSETRRAYAQSLIEALRTRAGSHGSGAVPALTFTGAGRTTAMHRLKAVLIPAAPASHRTRIAAAAGIAALLAVVAGGTVAVAAQREPETRAAGTADRAPGRVMINGEPVALDFGALPRFGLQADSIVSSAPGVRPAWTDFRTTPDPDAPPLSIEGVKLPAGTTTDIVVAADVARIDRTPEGLNIVLKRDDDRRVARPTRDVVVWMPVDFNGRAAPRAGDVMYVTLTDAAGALLAETMATSAVDGFPTDVRIPLTRTEFPRLGQGNRAYTLTAEIRRADGSVERADDTVTVRLAPGSQRTARNMSATLSFGG